MYAYAVTTIESGLHMYVLFLSRPLTSSVHARRLQVILLDGLLKHMIMMSIKVVVVEASHVPLFSASISIARFLDISLVVLV